MGVNLRTHQKTQNQGRKPTNQRNGQFGRSAKMTVRNGLMTTTAMIIAAVAIMGTSNTPALAQDAAALDSAGKNGKDWLTYHGSYQSWHYSPLDQINASNINKLKVAFIHQVGRSTRGVQSMPLAKDGNIYYSASYSKVFALKGDTGEVLW